MMIMIMMMIRLMGMIGDLHVVASRHRETTALRWELIYVAEIQN